MEESLVTKEEEKRLLTTYSPLSRRCYQGFSSALPALKAGRKNFTDNFPPLSLKVCLTHGNPKQFSSTLVKILLPLAIWTTFQLEKNSSWRGSAPCSTHRCPYKGGRIFPLTFSLLQRCLFFPESPALGSSAILTPNSAPPWPLEPALNGRWAIPIADCNLHWINEADTLFNEWNTFPFIIVAQTRRKKMGAERVLIIQVWLKRGYLLGCRPWGEKNNTAA